MVWKEPGDFKWTLSRQRGRSINPLAWHYHQEENCLFIIVSCIYLFIIICIFFYLKIYIFPDGASHTGHQNHDSPKCKGNLAILKIGTRWVFTVYVLKQAQSLESLAWCGPVTVASCYSQDQHPIGPLPFCLPQLATAGSLHGWGTVHSNIKGQTLSSKCTMCLGQKQNKRPFQDAFQIPETHWVEKWSPFPLIF